MNFSYIDQPAGGEGAPRLQKHTRVYVYLLLPELLRRCRVRFEIKFESLPRNDLGKLITPSIFPISQRDFSFEIDNKVSYEQIENCIHISSKNFLIGTKIFDIYDGKNISDGKKSIAFRVSWGSNKKTLSEDEINKEANLIISGTQKKLGATLR